MKFCKFVENISADIKANIKKQKQWCNLFEHFLSRWVSEIEHFEIFISRLRENKLAQGFFVKFNLGVFHAYMEEYKHKHNVS